MAEASPGPRPAEPISRPAAHRSGAPSWPTSPPGATLPRRAARLIAEGLTNKEVGARLFISERTVDTHVRHILDKLGMDSRTRIVAWIVGASASET